MPRQNEPTTRMCLVTRQVKPVADLVFLVIGPDGAVVPDLRHRLPGRGVWITATADSVREAERRKLFARGFKEPVTAAPGLADRVEALLRDAAVQSLGLARKAGELTSGFAKVEAAIAAGKVAGLIHAAEAADDGIRKLDAAMRRNGAGPGSIPVIRGFTAAEIGLALGRPDVIHAALLAGPASRNVLERVAALDRFLGREPEGGTDILPLRPKAEPFREGLATHE